MRLVHRGNKASSQLRPPFNTGHSTWDQALQHYWTRYPRLCAHIADVIFSPRARLGIKHVPKGEPFAVIVLNPSFPPADRFDAVQQLGIYLRYLAHHIRNGSRSTGPVVQAPSSASRDSAS